MQSARGFEYGVRHILSPQSGLISDILINTLALNSIEIQFLLNIGGVYLNGKRISEDLSIPTGAYLRIHTKPRRFPVLDIDWKNLIVYSNEDFLIVNKPSGIPVHASVDNLQENLHFSFQKELAIPLFVTHRLDVPTRGLILFAKSAVFQNAFNTLLAERKIKKTYVALVEGHHISTGIIRHYMQPSPRAPKNVCSTAQPGWQECLLEISSSTNQPGGLSELKINLLTGRTHQIRAQLAAQGAPIVGDVAYGAKKAYSEDKIELEARELEFTCPKTEKGFAFKS